MADNSQKVAIVTGGGTGLGKAIALQLAADGFRVVVNGQQQDPLNEVAAKIGDGKAIAIAADVSDREAVDRMIGETVDRFGRIDVVVNNAGVVKPGTVDTLSDEDFDLMMKVNVYGVRNVSLAALPELRKTNGNIVNVLSVSGLRADWGMYGYNASKGAVVNYTRSLAIDLSSALTNRVFFDIIEMLRGHHRR